MKELRLESLRLKNFKGMKDYTFCPGGQDTSVYAANAKGKTTIVDAWTWLLFGKDSHNSATFELKTLDDSGEALHGLKHEVEGVLTLDGKTITLRRVFSETWTKKRGSAQATFTGHSTDYWIDGVPAKAKEYTAAVAEICEESIFRLLTNPAHFNGVMKWEQRRRLLLDICGDITDADVIASDEALSVLPNILGERSLEDHRKVIAEKRKKINEEIEALPIRIDEITKGLPGVIVPHGRELIESELQQLRAQAQEKHQEKARIEAGGEVAEKKRKLAEVEAELFRLAGQMWDEANQDGEAERQELTRLRDEFARFDADLRAIVISLRESSNLIEVEKTKLDNLRHQWHDIDAEGYQDEDTCAACGQALPAERVEEARAAHNRSKAERLAANHEQGKRAAGELKKAQEANEQLALKKAGLETELDQIRQQLESLSDAPAPAKTDPMENSKYAALTLEKEGIEAEIDQLSTGSTETLAAVDQAIEDIQAKIRQQDETLAQLSRHARDLERIDQLKAEEKALSAQYERLEEELYLCESFVRSKVAMLEERINSRFRIVTWKLFDEQINGGLSECCECLVDGVPYSGGLNTGARIRSGLDIITTLTEHFGFVAPIFVDNAESITDPIVAPGQLIRLIASPEDKALRIETQKPALKEAV